MAFSPDVAVFDDAGKVVLIVEIIPRKDVSRKWASKLLQNLWSNDVFTAAPFFLMVSPFRSFLWQSSSIEAGNFCPAYEFESDFLLNSFTSLELKELSEASLEIVVASWLLGLVQRNKDPGKSELDWFKNSGLAEAIEGGSIIVEPLI